MSEDFSNRPEWLNDNFIKTCVKNDIQAESLNDIDIEDVTLHYVVPKGENFTSAIVRLTVTGNFGDIAKARNGTIDNGKAADVNGKHINVNGTQNGISNGNIVADSVNKRKYVIKIPHKLDIIKVFMDEYGFFKRELEMYQSIFPKFQKLLANAGISTTFCCRAVHVLPEEEVIVMEDLGVKEYILGKRIEGADLDECRVLYRKLARLHGASMKYYQDNSVNNLSPYYFKGMVTNVEDEHVQDMIDNFFGKTIIQKKVAGMAEVIKKRPGYEREYELITKIKDISYDLLLDLFAYKPDNPFNAHLHGDCWINNMLFKYDKNKRATDVMLLDMQCTYYNSVANEFLYFFLSSASNDVRKYHYKCVVKFYFDNLIDTLEKVGYKGVKPTLEQFYKELVAKSSLFFIMLCFMLPVLKAEHSTEAKDRSKSEAFTMEEVTTMGDDNFANPKYIEALFVTIDLLREEGIIDHHYEILKNRQF